jgi:hypothetical protein
MAVHGRLKQFILNYFCFSSRKCISGEKCFIQKLCAGTDSSSPTVSEISTCSKDCIWPYSSSFNETSLTLVTTVPWVTDRNEKHLQSTASWPACFVQNRCNKVNITFMYAYMCVCVGLESQTHSIRVFTQLSKHRTWRLSERKNTNFHVSYVVPFTLRAL